ncbi:piggyBac transposable element-derived protein 4 [Trichonephila clavata]|uniref:PiggyBac transposable element-derived protein 4 n=2 Tax=Trichonephila clavata TaxID=2740835 RepID=A0A8X6F9I3_TRICU|nr:piggyBac transposable element-derived protein 4 [Trichonephila clavata]
MYKIADATGYTYDMRVYLGKDKKENLSTSATYNVVNAMTDCIKGKGHKVFMDSFFSSPELYRDLLKEKKINSCGTVRPNRKHFPKNLAPCKMKQGDLAVKFCNGMTAMCWKDKRQIADLKLATLPSCLCKVETLTIPPVAKMVKQDLQMGGRNFQLGPESAEWKGNFASATAEF